MINETVDKNEVNLFESMADEWWDETGSMSFLHAMSEIRTQFIVNEIINNFNIKRKNKILKNINILDIGCGGGIASEPLSRLGANLIGIDESKELIKVAQRHAEAMNLKIDYKNMSLENIVKKEKQFDVVIALELIEHINNIDYFCKLISRVMNNNGIIILSTINKTILSKLLVIDIAENLLKKIPKGTHSYEKFVSSKKIENIFLELNYKIKNIKGLTWAPFNRWILSDITSVNYIVCFNKMSNI